MNQPHELAEKINTELETHALRALISRYGSAREQREAVELENTNLLAEAAALPQFLAEEIERVETEIQAEKLVTEELNRLILERRQANLKLLNELEDRDSELKAEIASKQQKKLETLQSLDRKSRELAAAEKSRGLTRDEEATKQALALISSLPVDLTDTESTIDEKWQKISSLVRFSEEPHVPLLQKFPEVQEFLKLQ